MSKSTRSSSQLLPQIFQTEKNKRFVNSTLDQLIEPSVLERLSAYVGQRYRPSYRTTDVYVEESTSQRQNYQLEPTVVYKSDGNTVDFASQYIDAVNEISAQGGSSLKHDRLWEQESYAYCPPIDHDKLVNYRQYYWIANNLSPITLILGQGTTSTISVTNNNLLAFRFSNKVDQDNPDIIVYKGCTYNFEVDAPGHPFYIKTQYGTGSSDLFNSDYVDNNGADQGTVTLRVPASDSSTTVDNVLFYQCGNHVSMKGRIIIKDLELENFDPAEAIEGCKNFTDVTGLDLTNTINVQITSGSTSAYLNKKFFVDGVGDKITLTDIAQHEVVESYGTESGEIFDENGTVGWDTVGFDRSTGQSTTPDYWTINRASQDLNAWSRANRWVHVEAIKLTEQKLNTVIPLTEGIRAKRPIVEFLANLELFNHGNTGRLIDVIDTETTDALSKVQGEEGYFADGTALRKGDLVIFTADPDQQSKIFEVDLVQVSNPVDSTTVLQLILNESFTASEMLSVTAKRGNNQGVTYHVENGVWRASQLKTKINQKPLFDIFDNNHVSLSNLNTYVSSNFNGSTLFEIATDDSQGTPDTVYGTNVIYERLGLINDLRINDTFNSTSFQYVDNGIIVEKPIRQYHFHRYQPGSTNHISTNNWQKFKVPNSQKIIKTYQSNNNEHYFEIDHYTNSNLLNDLVVQVFLNGEIFKDYTTQVINTRLYVKTDAIIKPGNVITIKCHSKTGTPSGQGFFETPLSLQRNSKNQNFEKFTLGDIIKHYRLATYENTSFEGTEIGENNSRDLSQLFAFGSLIMQHSGNDPLAHILIKDDVINLANAMRFSGREYEKFKQSLIDRTSELSLDGDIDENFDRLIRLINTNKTSTMPFADTDMIGFNNDKTVNTYTVVDEQVVNYPISQRHNLNELSQRAVYVYLNNIQLVYGLDYEFTDILDSSNQHGVEIKTGLSVDDVIKIVEYDSTRSSFVPDTPAKLGLAPAFQPVKYKDDTYQTDDGLGLDVVRGHDGSITIAYGDFRDDLLLEFEKRVYNNIKIKHNPDEININYGFFRDNEYTYNEVLDLFARDFYIWTGTNAIDYATNETYQASNDFTWNYSNYNNSIDNTRLPGYWRAIYQQWFDTDYPHTRPWEILGFSIKPDWWDIRYGSAPYTKGNLLLWNDIADGFIAEGDRKGYYSQYAKGNNFYNIIPVTDNGRLASPSTSGVVGQSTVLEREQQANWSFGDSGPPETAWRKSSSYRFAEQICKFLAKPGKYAGLYFDKSRISKNIVNQYVYNGLYRQPVTSYILPSSTTSTSGWINVIFDYVKHLGYTASTYIANRFENISVQLSYKLGGFTNKDNLQVSVGSVSPQSTSRGVFLPDENFDILLYKSAPILTANYSGVIVQKTTNGYKLSGYSNFTRTFTYYKPKKYNDYNLIRVGATTESFSQWQSGGFYIQGSIVKNAGKFYRALSNISSGQTFDSTRWNEIGSALPLKGGVSIRQYKNYESTTSIIPYGTEFVNEQEVADFLFGYNEYLQEQGFIFDNFVNELNQTANWELSVKEFLFWSTQNWNTDAVITLSPAAQSIKFKKENTIGDDLTDTDQFYTVLQQDGLPISPYNLATKRQDGIFEIITNPVEDGIYNADIRAVQKEHLVLLDNASQFNDVIFDEVLGNRQDRIKLVGFKTANWNGDLYAPGYVIDQAKIAEWQPFTDYRIGENVRHQGKFYTSIKNHTSIENFDKSDWAIKEEAPQQQMLPNWDAKAEAFRDFYSLDSDNFDAEQQRYAQHLIGYQQREYFNNLGLEELTQFKFYQGMLKDKGTINPILKFRSQPQTGQTVSYSLFEDYAFRVGEFGGHRTQQEFAFIVNESIHLKNRLIYNITTSNASNTETVININERNSELLIKPYAFQGAPFSTYDYTQHQNTTQSIFAYPLAGYVLPSQATYTVFDETDLLTIDVSSLNEGNTIWIANTTIGDWDIRRVNSLGINTVSYKQFDDSLQITCNEAHGLQVGDYVAITQTNQSIDGIYQVVVADSTDDAKSFTIDYAKTFDSTNAVGVLSKISSIRINSINDIESITPPKGFAVGDFVYVDNNYTAQYPNASLWKVYQKSQDTNYSVAEQTFGDELATNAETGTDIVVSNNNLYLGVGAPGSNKVFVYLRNTTANEFSLRNDVSLDIGNTANDDRFGESLTITSDGARIFAGSPSTADIIKLTLSATSREYNRGTTIIGANSGATGTILDIDWNNDIIWVKNTGNNDFENEPLDIGDSSSVLTITAVKGSDATSQGAVHWINRDARSSYAINQTIVAPDVDTGGEFGKALSVSGDGTYLAVGAPGSPDDSATNDRGAVYIFKYAKDGSSARYDHHQTLIPDSDSQIGSGFGDAVKFAQDGNTLIVSAPSYDNDSTTSDAGKVYVYRLKNDIFYEHEKIVPNLIDDVKFGTAIDISQTGNDILIGAPRYTNTLGNEGGVFHYIAQTSQHVGDGSTTEFAITFDIDHSKTLGVFVDNTNVVQNNDSSTTPFYTLDGSSNTITFGTAPASSAVISVYQYSFEEILTAKKPQTNQEFGSTIALKDNTLIIQSKQGDAKLSTTFDRLSADGSTILSETTFDRNTTAFSDIQQDSGQVYVYNKLDTQFKYVQNLPPSRSLQVGADYGGSLAISQLSIYVGSPRLDTSFFNSGRVFVFEKPTSDLGWKTAYEQPNLVDQTKINNSFLYNKDTGQTKNSIPLIDPAKGKLFGEIQKNINYTTPYDPANYTSWDNDHNDEIWIDISKFKYFWYEQGSLDEKLNNWGKIHPSSVVNVNVWVESDLTPTQYNTITNTNEGQSRNITGVAQSNFVSKRIFNTNKSTFETKYFYWVTNRRTVDGTNTVSAQQIANAIVNPASFTSNFGAVISNRAVLLNLDRSQLDQSRIAFKIENTTDDEQLEKHTEHVLISKDDQNSEIPQQLTDKFFDSLIGFDSFGRSVPDVSQPEGLRYGSLNRPRQSWYKDRINALKIIVQFINDNLKDKPYATTKDLTKFLEKTALPSLTLGEYDRSVDTDVDLSYVNTAEINIGYKILVLVDSNVADGWAVYEWTGTEWSKTSQQTYDTQDYWEYVDWYADGYSADTVADYVVDNERIRLNGVFSVGDVVKVKSSYDGEFRLYQKTSSNWTVIGIQNGTIQLSTKLYDYANNQVGFGADAYGSALYDAEAVTELRNILQGIKSWAVDEDALLFNKLFFIGVRIAQQEQKDIDWVFKTSFVKLINTYSNLEQLREFQIDASDAVQEFLDEVLPFKTNVREDVTVYNNQDNFEGDVTDFDNKTYYDKSLKEYVTPSLRQDESTFPEIYQSYPWKLYSDNFKYSIGSIVVDQPGIGYNEPPRVVISGGGGSGATATADIGDGKVTRITVVNEGSGYYTTPTVTLVGGGGGSVQTVATAHAELKNQKIRSLDTSIKFDRVNSLRQIDSETIVDWSPFTVFIAGSNIRYLNELYRVEEEFTSGKTFDDNVLLSDSSSVTNLAPIQKWTATDRIHKYYSPTTGMSGLIGDGSTTINVYSQLMTGIEYPGVKVQGLSFAASTGYDLTGFDLIQYDTNIVVTDAQDPQNLDQILDSKTFTTELGKRAEDINVLGDAFISEYSAHAPEEVLPGGVYDTMDLKVFTKQTDGHSIVVKKNYYGDGSTKTYATPSLGAVDGLKVFKNNIALERGRQYTLDYANQTIQFVQAPEQDAIISLMSIQVATDNLIAKFDLVGNGSTTTYNLKINYNYITQTYVLVNGVKTSVTLQLNADGITTDVIFPSAPDTDTDIQVFFFDLPADTKAFSEVVTTQYSDIPTDSTEFQIDLDPKSLVIGPHHHKVIVEGVSGVNKTNRYKLEPPQVSYYTGDDSTVDFIVPDEPVSSTLADITNVEVWLNGVKLQNVADFTIATSLGGDKVVTLSTAPSQDDVVAVVFKSGHDYEVDATGKLTLLSGWNDDSSIDAESVFVTTFTNHDNQYLRTELFSGSTGEIVISSLDYGQISDAVVASQDFGDLTANTQPDEDFGFVSGNIFDADIIAKRYRLSATPISEDYVFVAVNKQYLTANHDYTLDGDELIIPKRNLGVDDVISVTYFNQTRQQPSIAYRVFKDIINRYHYKRISNDYSTELVGAISVDSTEITVKDAGALGNPDTSTNTPGVVFIGTERIAFFEKDGNVLKRLYRGTLGTGIQNHVTGTRVVDASGVQNIPYEDTTSTTTFTGDGTTSSFALSYIPNDVDDITVFVGGEKIDTYSVGTDSASAVTLDQAPASGVQVNIVRKTGTVWYDKGTSSASNGLGLQQSTNNIVQFLQDKPANLSLI